MERENDFHNKHTNCRKMTDNSPLGQSGDDGWSGSVHNSTAQEENSAAQTTDAYIFRWFSSSEGIISSFSSVGNFRWTHGTDLTTIAGALHSCERPLFLAMSGEIMTFMSRNRVEKKKAFIHIYNSSDILLKKSSFALKWVLRVETHLNTWRVNVYSIDNNPNIFMY